MISPVRFVERRRELEALQVTADNLAAVAHWCGGRVISDHTGPVAVGVPIGHSVLRAIPGQWVIRRIGSDGSVHHHPVPEQELFFSWKPDDAEA